MTMTPAAAWFNKQKLIRMNMPVKEDGSVHFTTTLFEMDPNELRTLSAEGDAWLLRLDAVKAPDSTTPEAEALRTDFAAQTAVDLSNGISSTFIQSLINAADVEINQAALNAVGAHRP